MNPDDLIKAINRPEARKCGSTTKSEKKNNVSFLEELLGDFSSQAVFYGVAALGLWFLSQKWAWLAFLMAGLLLMFGIPAYFLFKRK